MGVTKEKGYTLISKTNVSFTKRRSNTMKKAFKAIGIIATMGIMLVSAYLLGTTQAETVTEVQTVTE